jgi:penicillin-binding protein 1C
VGALLDSEALFTRLNALGFALPHQAGYYGPALALGGADVTLLALANAYRTLANSGMHSGVVMRSDASGGAAPSAAQRVAPAAAVHLVTDILADNSARAATFGLSSALTTPGFAAVKTGTSKDLRDNWCVGFTDRYTVGVWVGNASGAPMRDVSGISGAAPVWQALVRLLHAAQPSIAPRLPAGVVRQAVRFAAGEEPVREEVFVAGTQQPLVRAGLPVFGITSPRDGSVFALDPDIPPAAQRLTFTGESGTWLLDGRRLGTARQVRWAPWPGRHELTLIGRDGQVRQMVRFEVRGATAKLSQAPP